MHGEESSGTAEVDREFRLCFIPGMNRCFTGPLILVFSPLCLLAAETFVFDHHAEAYAGLVSKTFSLHGTNLTVTAALEDASTNSNALLAANASGLYLGIQSSDDPGGGEGPRIANTRDELLLLSFNHPVEITEIRLRSFNASNGSEQLRMRLESGPDPFSGLSGYSGDYSIQASPIPRLKWESTGGANGPNTVPFGVAGQAPLVVSTGTVFSISSTASSTTGGGFMVESITVELPGQVTRPPASPGPNIIMMLADDLGWTDLSTGKPNLGNGSAFYETPNVARLADQSLCFTSCYMHPNCSPTRAALFSGQYAPRAGNGVYNVNNLNRGNGTPILVGPSQNEDVPADTYNLAEAMRDAGYITAHFGKFHVGGHEGGSATLPLNQGFDFNYGGQANGAPGSYFASSGTFGGNIGPELDPYASPYTSAYLADRGFVDTNALVGTDKHLTDAMGDAFVDFMNDHRSGLHADYPVYMQFHLYAVHSPIQPRPDLPPKYQVKPPDGGHDHANYASQVDSMDQAVGRIMDYLDDPDGDGSTNDSMVADTVLIFASDNGGFIGPTDNTPLRERKGSFYEGGIRVPFMVRWPGEIPADTRTDTLVHPVDFYPTFLALAGAAEPTNQVLDGTAFADHLRDPATPRPREAIVYHFPGYLDTRAWPSSTVIKDIAGERYKMIYYYEDGKREMYNLSQDLSETNDLLDGDYWKWLLNQSAAEDLAETITQWLTRDEPDWAPSYPTVRASGTLLSAPPPGVDPVVVPRDEQFRMVEPVVMNPPTGIRLSWPAIPGHTFGLEASSDLESWTLIVDDLITIGNRIEYTFTDPPAALGRRYYRVFVD